MNVTVHQLQKHLPEIIDRATKDEQACIVERNGEPIAVIVSAREWRRHTIGKRLDALGSEFRLSKQKQRRAEELLAEGKQRRLTPAKRRELSALLRESDDVMLRRAQAMNRV